MASLPRRLRFLRSPAFRDWALALFLALASLGSLLSEHPAGRVERLALPFLGLVALAATLPVAFRLRWPIEVFAVVGIANGLLTGLDVESGPASFAVLVAVFTVAAHKDQQASRTALLVGAAAGIAVILIGPRDIAGAIFWGPLAVAAWALGERLKARRLRIAAERAEAEREVRERELLTERRLTDERLRIARELHDVVAHGVSVMVVQAGAARTVLDTDPERAKEAMRAVEETGRDALAEMRRLLGLLRSGRADEPERAPQPGIGDLDALVAQSNDAGTPTRLERSGVVDDVPDATALTVYRIAQEALTNVRRHAGPGARATVRLAREGDELAVEVIDDGRGGTPVPGHGLAGMRERAAALGGTVEAGPAPGRGFRVAARIPLAARVPA